MAAHKKENAMVAILIYLEPNLIALCNRLAKMSQDTRSTYIRKIIKLHHFDKCRKISGVDWVE
jgi:hypothetical protein